MTLTPRVVAKTASTALHMLQRNVGMKVFYNQNIYGHPDMGKCTVLGVSNVVWCKSISHADWGWFWVEFDHEIGWWDTATQLLVHKSTGMNVC